MEPIIKQFIALLAKIGIYYANVDGISDESEKTSIRNFLKNMANEYKEEYNEEDLMSLMNSPITFKDIVSEYSGFIKSFNKEEKILILASTDSFIEEVIKADGKIQPSELEQFVEWKEKKDYFLNL